MRALLTELRFALSCFRLNIASAMEYRFAFLSQVVFMIVNDAIYFVFWAVFFDRFEQVRGWEMADMWLLFAIVAGGFGLAFTFFGNAPLIAQLVAQGRLDYYLALPRNVLLHVLITRSSISAIGDVVFGAIAYFFTRRFDLQSIALAMVGALCAGTVLVSFSVLVGSLAFFMGGATQVSEQARNALLTFALYPNTIFQGAVKFILLLIIPAGFVGAIPVQLVNEFSWLRLGVLVGGALAVTILSIVAFYAGLRRYESGSALNVNL